MTVLNYIFFKLKTEFLILDSCNVIYQCCSNFENYFIINYHGNIVLSSAHNVHTTFRHCHNIGATLKIMKIVNIIITL